MCIWGWGFEMKINIQYSTLWVEVYYGINVRYFQEVLKWIKINIYSSTLWFKEIYRVWANSNKFSPFLWRGNIPGGCIIHEFYPSFISKQVVHNKEEQDGAQTSPLWHAPMHRVPVAQLLSHSHLYFLSWSKAANHETIKIGRPNWPKSTVYAMIMQDCASPNFRAIPSSL